MRSIRILGAGPAGSAAALVLGQQGCPVEIYEKSKFPRHKVCGEFLSPEVAPLLGRLGVWPSFLRLQPAPIRRIRLAFEKKLRATTLPETAWGCSRFSLDDMLLNEAKKLGAIVFHEAGSPDHCDILTAGRSQAGSGPRIFGFKAHFRGPIDDAVELYFFHGCYVGVSPVENGATNVCGLGPEEFLRRHEFDYDEVISRCRPLSERLQPLTRSMNWLSAGPLVYQNSFGARRNPNVYPAGDQLSFVDPFTGTGIVSALLTGSLSGHAVASGAPVQDYLKDCRRALGSPFQAASCLRWMLRLGIAESLLSVLPAPWLFKITRPHSG